MPDQIACPTCGAAATAGAPFCPSCGNAIPAAPPAGACPSCGAALRPGMRFCAACGAATAPSPQPVAPAAAYAPAPQAPVMSACQACGAPLGPASKFCRACGAATPAAGPGWQQWTPTQQAAPKKQNTTALLLAGVAVAAIVGVVLFLLLRGGGDDNKASDTGASRTPARTVTTSTGKVLPAAQAELADMTVNLAGKTFKVTYDIKGSDTVSKKSLQATLTLISAPPQVAVIFDAGSKGLNLADLLGDAAGDSGITITGGAEQLQVFSLIYDGKTSTYLCMKAVGQEGQCQHSITEPSDSGSGESLDLGALLTQLVDQGSNDETLKVEQTKGQKIAGRDTNCYVLSRAETTDTGKSDIKVTICIDKEEGLPLLVEGKGSGEGSVDSSTLPGGTGIDTSSLPSSIAIEGSMKAKSVAYKVSDSDFKPPYKVVEATD